MKCKFKIKDNVVLKNDTKHKIIGYSKFFGTGYYKIKNSNGEGIIHVSEIKGCKDERKPIESKSLKQLIMSRGK